MTDYTRTKTYSGKVKGAISLTFYCLFISCNSDIHSGFHSNSDSTIWGIDISHHQRNIDWSLLSTQKPHFIFFKATEGATHKDTKYHDYAVRARRDSIIVGAYHYFSYQSSGKDQALFFLKVANPQKGDLPPVLDVEFRKKMPERKKVTNEILDFIETIDKEMGIKPIIYCECDYYNKYIKPYTDDNNPLWISDFWREPRCSWLFWQKTDRHKIKGIAGTVDYNIFKGKKQELINLLIE